MSSLAFNVKGDMKAVLKDLRHVDRNLKERASVVALNRAATAVRGQSAKRTAAKLRIKQKLLTKRMRIIKAKHLLKTAVILAAQRGISYSEIGNVRQLSAGAAVGRLRFPGMFYARMPAQRSGRRHEGIFFRVPGTEKRLTRKGRYAGTGIRRQPIKEKLLWHKNALDDVIKQTMDEVGRARFRREFERYLRWKLGS